KFAHDHGLSKNNPLKVETGRGVLTLELETRQGRVERATVDMGEPILEAARIPTTLPGPRLIDHPLAPGVEVDAWLADCGLDPRLTLVSMGNPHLVLYCRDVARVPLEAVGPGLETHPWFP